MRKLSILLMSLGVCLAVAGTRLIWISDAGQVQAAREFRQSNTAELSRISFPEQQKSYVVLEGATEENLLRGPARVLTSARPGEQGNTIIAAHRDTQFRVLKDVKLGDYITVEAGGQPHRYRVVDLQKVQPADERFLRPTPRAVLTLVTCYPFYFVGPAPKRYVVRAELVSPGA